MYQIQTAVPTLVNDKNFHFWFSQDVENRDERIRRIKFHVDQDDYFNSLAIILDILNTDERIINKTQAIDNLIDDLKYLQKNYEIKKKY